MVLHIQSYLGGRLGLEGRHLEGGKAERPPRVGSNLTELNWGRPRAVPLASQLPAE